MIAENTTRRKIYVFIDAANIIYGCNDAGWKMDFEKLIGYLKTRYGATRVLYYAGLDNDNKKQLLFYELLQRFNYELKLVPVKTYNSGKRRGDVDARLTFEAMKHLNEFDEAIFLTGDGDYFWLLKYLLEKNKKIKLLAHRQSTAKELKKLFGGAFTDISRLKAILEFQEKQRR